MTNTPGELGREDWCGVRTESELSQREKESWLQEEVCLLSNGLRKSLGAPAGNK